MSLKGKAFLRRLPQLRWYITAVGIVALSVMMVSARPWTRYAAAKKTPVDYLEQRKQQYRREQKALQQLIACKVAEGAWSKRQADQQLLDRKIGIESRFINDCRSKSIWESRYIDAMRQHLILRYELICRCRVLKQSGQWIIKERYLGQRLLSAVPFASRIPPGAIIPPPFAQARNRPHPGHLMPTSRAPGDMIPPRFMEDGFWLDVGPLQRLTPEAAKRIELIR